MNTLSFPGWHEVIAQDDTLSPEQKQAYPVTIRWFLGYLKRNKQKASVSTARDFIVHAVEQKSPKPAIEQKWKDALNWFFRNGKKIKTHNRILSKIHDECNNWGAPALDLDKLEPWEAKMISLIRRRSMAYKTEQNYVAWIRRFMQHADQVPEALNDGDIINFLSHLAVETNVSANTQRQALNAIVFYMRDVEGKEVGDLSKYQKAPNRKRLPVVFTQTEVKKIFENMEGRFQLMARLQYGTGLRRSELINLRIKDVELERKQLFVRQGKGGKDRVVPLPESIIPDLKLQINHCRQVYDSDRASEANGVCLPQALERKYPKHGKRWEWFWLWPAQKESVDPRTKIKRRHHDFPEYYQRELLIASTAANMSKPVKTHYLRHSFATHLLEAGENIRTVQDLLGHKSIETTQIYLHVLENRKCSVVSPLDSIAV